MASFIQRFNLLVSNVMILPWKHESHCETVGASVCFCLFWPCSEWGKMQHNNCRALMGCRRMGFMAKVEKTRRNYRQRRQEYVVNMAWICAGVGRNVLIGVELRGTRFDCGVVWPGLTQAVVPLPAAQRTIVVIKFKWVFSGRRTHTHTHIRKLCVCVCGSVGVCLGSVWALLSWILAQRNLLADDITASCLSQH